MTKGEKASEEPLSDVVKVPLQREVLMQVFLIP